ncbi:MAG: hydrogenase nickel incorporation protein HypB [Desulfohalobiaceae bacterium]
MQIPVVRKILETNELTALDLQQGFQEQGILVLNLISSPGAGKTTLLVRTLSDLAQELNMAVIEGDLQTSNDAEKIAATGARVLQINTQGACHLEGSMIGQALQQMDLADVDVLFIENVGNLVCPAEFKLGEDYKIALLSVPEGDDKPEKYPVLFAESSLLLLNKIDLMPYLEFDTQRASNAARAVNQALEVIQISAQTGEGLQQWYDWLRRKMQEKRQIRKE